MTTNISQIVAAVDLDKTLPSSTNPHKDEKAFRNNIQHKILESKIAC